LEKYEKIDSMEIDKDYFKYDKNRINKKNRVKN
jgi:hypothetical protein